ncbi:MAG: acyl-CoA dehydrogenase family protein, partial [Candidatus Kariarchaeaceae archaeon]
MLGLNEEQEMIIETVRDLVNDKIKPRAQEYDNTAEFPWDNMKDLAEIGIVGMTVAEEYGGFGSDMLTYAASMEEVSRGCAATATTVAGVNSLAIGPIQEFGSAELKQEFLPRFVDGSTYGAFALSEPQAGSDAASLTTRAERDGEDFIINGSKIYITNAIVSDLFIVFARSLDVPGSRGISAFVVPKDVDGI